MMLFTCTMLCTVFDIDLDDIIIFDITYKIFATERDFICFYFLTLFAFCIAFTFLHGLPPKVTGNVDKVFIFVPIRVCFAVQIMSVCLSNTLILSVTESME